MMSPFGFGPQRSDLVPSLLVSTADTNVHVPMSCSLSDFCWAKASPGNEASPNAVIAQRMLRRFIVFLRGPDSGARANLRAHAKRMLLGREDEGLLIEGPANDISAAAGKRGRGTTLLIVVSTCE